LPIVPDAFDAGVFGYCRDDGLERARRIPVTADALASIERTSPAPSVHRDMVREEAAAASTHVVAAVSRTGRNQLSPLRFHRRIMKLDLLVGPIFAAP